MVQPQPSSPEGDYSFFAARPRIRGSGLHAPHATHTRFPCLLLRAIVIVLEDGYLPTWLAMKDLSRHSISTHIISLAAPVGAFMLTQIARQLVDLYFVTGLGPQATAGVNAAGGLLFLVGASTQILNAGTSPLVAQAVEAKDRLGANIASNRSLLLSVLACAGALAVLSMLTRAYMYLAAADQATADAGATVLYWMLPGTALAFPTRLLTVRHWHRCARHHCFHCHDFDQCIAGTGAHRWLGRRSSPGRAWRGHGHECLHVSRIDPSPRVPSSL